MTSDQLVRPQQSGVRPMAGDVVISSRKVVLATPWMLRRVVTLSGQRERSLGLCDLRRGLILTTNQCECLAAVRQYLNLVWSQSPVGPSLANHNWLALCPHRSFG